MADIEFDGNLTADPELQYNNEGKPWARFTVGHNPRRYDRATSDYVDDGEAQFYSCVVFGKQAEDVTENLRKGSRVAIKGKLSHRSYTTQSGEDRVSHDVRVDKITQPIRSGDTRPAPTGAFTAPAGGTANDPWATPAPAFNAGNPPF